MSLENEKYEHQFWGFTAKDLSTGLRNVIIENIQDVIDVMLGSFKKRFPEEVWPALSSACQTLLEESSQKAGEHIQTVEAYIQENFSIPPHILLEEDSVQRQQYSDEEIEKMNQKLKDLQRRINRVHFMEYHLYGKLENNKELKSISEKVEKLPVSEVATLLRRKSLQQLVFESTGLEVEAASCHLKDEDSEQSGDFNQPNHALNVFKNRQAMSVKK